jgi:hypothetical protein
MREHCTKDLLALKLWRVDSFAIAGARRHVFLNQLAHATAALSFANGKQASHDKDH